MNRYTALRYVSKAYQPRNQVYSPHCPEPGPPRPAPQEREHTEYEDVRYDDQMSYVRAFSQQILLETPNEWMYALIRWQTILEKSDTHVPHHERASKKACNAARRLNDLKMTKGCMVSNVHSFPAGTWGFPSDYVCSPLLQRHGTFTRKHSYTR